jgi:hypothetical protein
MNSDGQISMNQSSTVNGVANGPVTAPQNTGAGGNMPRMNNIQRIQLRKQQVREWPRPRKLEKLAAYSTCKVIITTL